MGDYTGLRFSAKLKKEAIPLVGMLYSKRKESASQDVISPQTRWDDIAYAYPHPSLIKWARVSRCMFIPFGALCYMPDTWKPMSPPVDDKWEVCCSLKNYEDEIGIFLEEVLPLLIQEPCSCEVLFEAYSFPKVFMVQPREGYL